MSTRTLLMLGDGLSSPERRRVIRLAGTFVLTPAIGLRVGTALAQPTMNLSVAINRAGRLRALSQRLVKANAQLVLGVMPERSQEIVLAVRALIQNHLTDLGKSGVTGDGVELLRSTNASAERLLAATSTAPVAAKLGEINRHGEQLLGDADRLTSHFESKGKPAAKILNTAARQRMLSQRIAKAFMLGQAGYDVEAMRREQEAARLQFGQALDQLDQAVISTPAIKETLALARTQWVFYQNAMGSVEKEKARRDMATSSELILDAMNRLTDLYDAALRDLLGAVASSDTRYAGWNARV